MMYILVTSGLCVILFLLRNEIVFNVRCRASDEAFAYPTTPESERILLKYDRMSYNAMMLMLHKWTFKQFYGDGNG